MCSSDLNAGLYVQATVGLKILPLTPWQGLGVLAGQIQTLMHNGQSQTITLGGAGGTLVLNGATLPFAVTGPNSLGGGTPHG